MAALVVTVGCTECHTETVAPERSRSKPSETSGVEVEAKVFSSRRAGEPGGSMMRLVGCLLGEPRRHLGRVELWSA